MTGDLGEACEDSRYGKSPPFQDPVTITYFHGGYYGFIVEFRNDRATKVTKKNFGNLN